MVKSVNQVKEINVYLNDSGRLESTMKTCSILIGSNAEIVWVKYKNTLSGNNDAVLRIDRQNKEAHVIKKYSIAVSNNDFLQDLLSNLEQLGFRIIP